MVEVISVDLHNQNYHTQSMRQSVAIIGVGPSAMCLAAHLDSNRYAITIYEGQQSIGRKFLVAGKGGFNLTYDEPLPTFKEKYRPAGCMDSYLEAFSPEDLKSWLAEIGVPTYSGTSKRVFPEKGMKPIEVLTKIKAVLAVNDVQILTNQQWSGWNAEGNLVFGSTIVDADIVVFALGGGSWKITGSDGGWSTLFEEKGIDIVPFRGVNCGFTVEWDSAFIQMAAGKPLKNIVVTHHDSTKSGELVITDYGLEGNAIYGLSNGIQSAFSHTNRTTIHIDLKPSLSIDNLITLLKQSDLSITKVLSDKVKLSKIAIKLIKTQLSKKDYTNPEYLATSIKALPIQLGPPRSLDEAISTIGGVPLSELSNNLELQLLPNHYCIGEMINWYAPTGGYLLQGCMSMGVYIAKLLNNR